MHGPTSGAMSGWPWGEPEERQLGHGELPSDGWHLGELHRGGPERQCSEPHGADPGFRVGEQESRITSVSAGMQTQASDHKAHASQGSAQYLPACLPGSQGEWRVDLWWNGRSLEDSTSQGSVRAACSGQQMGEGGSMQ